MLHPSQHELLCAMMLKAAEIERTFTGIASYSCCQVHPLLRFALPFADSFGLQGLQNNKWPFNVGKSLG